jgi:predicted small secreted protein
MTTPSYAAALALVLTTLTACGTASGSPGRDARPEPVAVTVPPGTEGVTVSPAAAAPGDTVELTFDRPREVRGIAWSLATGPDEADVLFHLTSPGAGGGEPTWWAVDDGEGRGWVDLGVTGPGPDPLVVPDTAEPGDYLLCTANAAQQRCTTLTVTAG